MTPLRIHLCDLTHESVILVSDTIPINIGFVGSYAKKIHGDLVDISLFKYPEDAIKATLSSFKLLHALLTALRAASSQDSVLVPTNSITL